MGLREELGGKLEAALNKLVDDKLGGLGKDMLKAEGYKLVDSLVDKHYDNLLAGLGDKIKKDVIDMIDGEDDIV